jgi:hypothetical protein
MDVELLETCILLPYIYCRRMIMAHLEFIDVMVGV